MTLRDDKKSAAIAWSDRHGLGLIPTDAVAAFDDARTYALPSAEQHSPFDKVGADRMAAIIDDMIRAGKLDARSPLADARLDYGQPFPAAPSTERASLMERGPWRYEANDATFYSGDFEHDAALKLTGDFADDHQKAQYAAELLLKLATPNAEMAHAPQIDVIAEYHRLLVREWETAYGHPCAVALPNDAEKQALRNLARLIHTNATRSHEALPTLTGFEHDLKCWPDYFEDVQAGRKTFELRKDDRAYKVGDVLFLREWRPDTGAYTGRECRRVVTHLIRQSKVFGLLNEGACLMSMASTPSAIALREKP